MGGLALREADYVWVTEQLVTIAAEHAHRRIVSVLEGGYALHALGRCATAHIKVLSGL
jgi:acetoin utilization deacetylase AcuC-like enzyme